MHELGSLLGRWHQWRRSWSHERKHSRVALLAGPVDPEDELESQTMTAVELVIATLSPEHQLALQHVARAECMGVEVILNRRLGDRAGRQRLVAEALRELERALTREGVL